MAEAPTPERMPIGPDIALLCEAATAVTGSSSISQRHLQRRLRVGFVKAQRLLLLMDDYSITGGAPFGGDRAVLLSRCDLPAQLAELRGMAAREVSAGE